MAQAQSARLKAQKIFDLLKPQYPEVTCSLDYRNPFELLIATMLSAQCTDKRVNMVTPALFARFPTARLCAKAKLEELEQLIGSINFYRNKARAMQNASQVLVDNFNGEVPDSLAALVSLPGVGRKTANVVLGNAFGISAVVVDTHVKRLSFRLGLTQSEDPEVIEQDLAGVVKKDNWIEFSHLLIAHGRALCKAKNPTCSACVLRKLCEYAS